MELLFHPHTETYVAQFVAQPSHAVLLLGSNGMGKGYAARLLAAQLLDIEPEKIASQPYVMSIEPEKGTISIDVIRELQHFLQLKTLGGKPIRRAIIVEHAESLTTEAQNAYLKLLEEPPADTVMILTADNPRALLPTIMSRVQTITMHPPSEHHIKSHFAGQGKSDEVVNQAYFLSGGLPGLMHALLAEDEQHPLTAAVATAKQVLQAQTFERLALVEGLSKQKTEASYVLEALQHIAQTGLGQAANKGDVQRLGQWHHILSVATAALVALRHNANPKLTLSNMMLAI